MRNAEFCIEHDDFVLKMQGRARMHDDVGRAIEHPPRAPRRRRRALAFHRVHVSRLGQYDPLREDHHDSIAIFVTLRYHIRVIVYQPEVVFVVDGDRVRPDKLRALPAVNLGHRIPGGWDCLGAQARGGVAPPVEEVSSGVEDQQRHVSAIENVHTVGAVDGHGRGLPQPDTVRDLEVAVDGLEGCVG